MGDLSPSSPVSMPCFLVNDFLRYKLNQKGHAWEPQQQLPVLSTSVTIALRRIADDFEAKNRISFDEMFSNLHITPDNAHSTFLGVINELFCEGVTWGRVIAMFAFGGEMAVQCAENGMMAMLDPLAQWMTAYLDDELFNWINDHGSWDAFTDFCNMTKEPEELKRGFNKAAKWGLAVGVIGALTVGALLAK